MKLNELKEKVNTYRKDATETYDQMILNNIWNCLIDSLHKETDYLVIDYLADQFLAEYNKDLCDWLKKLGVKEFCLNITSTNLLNYLDWFNKNGYEPNGMYTIVTEGFLKPEEKPAIKLTLKGE